MSERSSDPRQAIAQVRRRETGKHCLAAIATACTTVMFAAGCAQFRPSLPQSEGHIAAPAAKPAAPPDIPPPARLSTLVPPPVAQVKPQTYSVVVHEVPVKELLLALARDTKRNIDIHPGISGLVSLNAINETLEAILERVSKQVDLRYKVEGNTIIVSPDTPYSKTYQVNYVNMIRNTSSAIAVSGQVAGSGQGGQQQGSTPQGGSQSVSAVTTSSVNDFWKTLESTVRSILQSAQSQSAEAKAERLGLFQAEQRIRLQQAIANSASQTGRGSTGPLGDYGGSSSGPLGSSGSTFAAATGSASRQQSNLGLSDDVIVNPIAGTLTLTATGAQHALVSDYLTRIQSSTQRQVLIEATIIEVQLSDTYQAGIDWSRIAAGTGFTFQQRLLSGFGPGLTQAGLNFLQLGYANPTSDVGNIKTTIQLLQEFGNTRVLSSPKLMALNNQTALLKVVDNVVYFEVQAQTTTNNNVATTTFNSTAKTVSVGMVMGVTPQINEDGRVSLTVRPSISRVLRFKNDPNPDLARAGVTNPVPEIQTREIESVLQILSGQTAILGGLMQDEGRFSRQQVPGADKLGEAGDLLRFRNESAVKTELVIFLRPTVIPNPTLESDELKFFQRFLPQADSTPAPKPAP